MSRNTQRGNKYNAILVVVVAVIIGAVAIYTYLSKQRIERYARGDAEQLAEKISGEVDVYIDSAISSIQLTSYLVSETMSGRKFDNSSDVLELLGAQTPFNFIEYIDENGISLTDEGEAFDASDREYYKEGIKGNTGIWVNYNPKYSKEYLLNFYTPLCYEDEIVGVLTGTLGADTNIAPLLDGDFFGEDMVGIVCDGNGRIISSTIDTQGNDFFEGLMTSLGVAENDKEEYRRHVKEQDKNAFVIDGVEGKSLACVSINEKTGWQVIQFVPPKAFKSAIKKNIQGTYYVTILICALLIFFLVHMSMDSRRKHNELVKETDRVVKNYEQILTTTAFGTYKAIRRIDLETGESEYIYFEDDSVKQRDVGDWSEWLEGQRKNVHEDDYERVADFLSIEHIRKMVEGVNYSINFRSALKGSSGYFRTYTTNISVTNIEGKLTAIMSTIDNTDVVLSEKAQKRLLSSAASIYLSMHVLDLKKGTLEALNSSSHIDAIVDGRSNDVKNILKDTMSKLTDEQYLDAMMAFIDFDTLDERMQGTNTITLEFLGTASGWCRARFIAVDYDDNNRLSQVLWVVENIDAEKRRANKLLYLSETDLMTGVRNRGSGERKIKELVAAEQRGTFLLLDVDKFKLINDNFGHGIGDKVLIEVAKCLKESFRDTDIVMRLGGDEFAVFAKDIVDSDSVITLINSFFDRLDNISIEELGDYKITVSLGAAIKLEGDGVDFETLYRNADSGTYVSKKSTGNTYTFYK